MELLLWILSLVGWVVAIVLGIPYFEKRLDRVLDRWFFPCGALKPRRPCYSSYLKK